MADDGEGSHSMQPVTRQSRGDDGGDGAEASTSDRKAKLDSILTQFWREQLSEIKLVDADVSEFKNHPLPLARIKKIMKSDEDVRMISAEAPVLFAKACELFILELTHRSWCHSEENKRRTLQRNDIAAALGDHDVLDFLRDLNKGDFSEAADGAGASGAAAQAQADPQGLTSPGAFHSGAGPSHAAAGVSGAASGGAAVPQQYMQQQQQQQPAWSEQQQQAAAGAAGGLQSAGSGGLPGLPGMPDPALAGMDPKMQAHVQQQMVAAQAQYMQRQQQRQIQQSKSMRYPAQPAPAASGGGSAGVPFPPASNQSSASGQAP